MPAPKPFSRITTDETLLLMVKRKNKNADPGHILSSFSKK